MLKQTTLEFIKKLRDLQWFCNVGKLSFSDQVVPVSSWQEATKYCSQKRWYKIEMDAANFIGQSVRKNSLEQYNRWNELTKLIKPEFQELVDINLLPILEANHLPKVVKDCVEWDLLHFLIECEYEEIFSDGFFRKLAFWYLQGHFPCGWKGKYSEFPNGKLVVF